MKTFRQYLIEALERQEVEKLYNDFKQKLESGYKKIYPDSNFKVVVTKHPIDQIIKRSNPPEISGDRGNIPITVDELKHMFDTILDRFFRSKEEGGLAYQTGGFKINSQNEWEFQHKINIPGGKHFRCAIYAIKLNLEKGVNAKGKPYNKIKDFNDFHIITIFPSDVAGKDNPKYQYTNAIMESIDEETLNHIED